MGLLANDAARKRLELQWMEYGGNWDAFEKQIRLDGTKLEISVLDVCEKEFKASVVARKKRVQNWQLNRIKEWLVKIDELTSATKSMAVKGEIVEVPDNKVRLESLKYLVDKLMVEDKPRPQLQSFPAPMVQISQVEVLKERLSEHREEETIELRERAGESA